MHSSRMPTVRCSGRRGGVSPGVSAGGVCPGGCLPRGSLTKGVYAPLDPEADLLPRGQNS